MDFDKVAPRLYQGGKLDARKAYQPFTMIVLCAEELQPRLTRFRGKVIRGGIDDTLWPNEREKKFAFSAASKVAAELRRGGRVLVTCAAGWNRSGLVTGLALCMSTRMHPNEIVRRIQAARGEHALSNRTFKQIVERCRHSGRRSRGRRAA